MAEQTELKLGYVEQLYTFGDRGRHAMLGDVGPHVLSIGYLALTRVSEESTAAIAKAGAVWRRWYDFFPGRTIAAAGRRSSMGLPRLPARPTGRAAEHSERRAARPLDRGERVRPGLRPQRRRVGRRARARSRYELLYEAGLLIEAGRDGGAPPAMVPSPGAPELLHALRSPPHPRDRDLAAEGQPEGVSAVVVFELMEASFTLTELQRSVEAISGRHLHTQNFRRLVEGAALVEPTGAMAAGGRGRPAALFRFRREVLKERPAPGFRFSVRA